MKNTLNNGGEVMNLAETLKALRLERHLTQGELAQQTGLSVHSINSYESGRREPNSKAMAVLERFFNVSGEFLRGEVDRTTFLENSAAIQGRLDDLIILFQSFKQDFDCASQARQMLAVSVLSGVMQTVTQQLLREGGPADLDDEEICQVFSSVFNLNAQGRSELAKRAAELTQLSQYRG